MLDWTRAEGKREGKGEGKVEKEREEERESQRAKGRLSPFPGCSSWSHPGAVPGSGWQVHTSGRESQQCVGAELVAQTEAWGGMMWSWRLVWAVWSCAGLPVPT